MSFPIIVLILGSLIKTTVGFVIFLGSLFTTTVGFFPFFVQVIAKLMN